MHDRTLPGHEGRRLHPRPGKRQGHLALAVGIVRCAWVHVGIDAWDAHMAGGLDDLHERVEAASLLILGGAFRPGAVALEADPVDGPVDPALATAENLFDLIRYRCCV